MAKDNAVYRCMRNGRTQIMLCGDLENIEARDRLISYLPDNVGMVYSDPPWNPGNATYWRTHAKKDPCLSYNAFLDAWCSVVSECISRSANHIFTEQSANEKHCQMLLDAVARNDKWNLPLLEKWTVFYGSPGSISVKRPNILLHFGNEKITTNPEGMAGEPMTTRTCAGVGLKTGSWIVDPCVGKGMTSRQAHYFDWNCVGNELNPDRLEKTLQWLRSQGYEIKELS